MRVNQLAYGIIFFSVLLAPACTSDDNKDYQYVETSMRTYMQDIVPTELKPMPIKAKSDSEAYINAYMNFCLSRKLYDKEFKKSGTMITKPLSFKLLNARSEDITKSVIFNNKKQVENRIEKSVNSFELQERE